MKKKPKNLFCPKCSSREMVPIVYGYPNFDLLKEEKNGRVVLGGCLVEDDNPDWKCKTCGLKFREKVPV